MLPAHRHVGLRLFAEAPPSDSGDIARALAAALAPHGSAKVREHGPYWKVPEHLELTVAMTPVQSVASCLSALGVGGAGWTGDVWNSVEGSPFLHPSVRWVWVTTERAVTPPRFLTSDIVRILDTPTARGLGLAGQEARVRGSSAPDAADGTWHYAVAPDDGELAVFAEEHLEPTGRTAPPEPESTTWVSVSTDGRVTGSHLGRD